MGFVELCINTVSSDVMCPEFSKYDLFKKNVWSTFGTFCKRQI